MKKQFLIILSVLCLANAQAQNTTLLNKYRQMALEYNHDLKATQKNIEMSLELEKSAKADNKPKIGANVNFQYTGNPMELDRPPITFQGSHNQYGASLSLTQPIYIGGRILETIRLAQLKGSYATNQSELVRSSVCLQTDIQYWSTVARNEMINIATNYRNSIAELVVAIKERVDVGLTDPTDLLMAEVKLNEAEYQLMQAKNSFTTGVMALNSIIGMDINASTEVDPSLPIITKEDYTSLNQNNTRPEIKMAQTEIAIQKSNLKLGDSNYKPQLFAGIDGNYSSPGYNFKSDLNPNYAIYAKLSIPIFEWNKRRNDKRASSYRVGIANDNLNRVRDDIALEITSCRVAVTQAVDQVALTQNSLDKAQDNQTKILERYTEGKVSITEVINAQIYYQTSLTYFVQSKLEAQSQLSKLKNALNIK